MTQPWPMRKPPPQALVVTSKVNEHVLQGRQIRVVLNFEGNEGTFSWYEKANKNVYLMLLGDSMKQASLQRKSV